MEEPKPTGAGDGHPFESLDPEDWEALRRLAHRMVDDAIDDARTVRDRPVWRAPPAEVADAFDRPAPREPRPADEVYRDYRDLVVPYRMGNDHPRFWAWYIGTGSPIGALAAYLAAALNSNLGGANHAPNLVERQVVRWCAELVGMPRATSGLFTSGASAANLIGLAVARSVGADVDVRREGLRGQEAELTFYASTETHSCHQRSAELMGLGTRAFRRIPTDDGYRIDLDALERAVAEDRAAGRKPFCVIGNAGTVNTGAVDDLRALADFCARERLWFHVDGAIGALAVLAPSLAPSLQGLDRADSVAFDLHKWMHVPFEAGMVLVRHEAAHRATFALTPAYLERATRGLAGGEPWFSDYGVQLSRGFNALKAWMAFSTHGFDRYGRLMERNAAQARLVAERVAREPLLELMAPPGLNIVCFRAVPAGLADEATDRLNQELLLQVQERGIAAPSYTTIRGRYCLRLAIANHRTKDEDLHTFLDAVLELMPRCLDRARDPTTPA